MRISLCRRWRRLRGYGSFPSILLIFAIALLLFGLFWYVVNNRLYPVIKAMAISNATNRISETVSKAVADCVVQYQLTYQDFITVNTDASGNITSLTSNLSTSSLLRNRLVSTVVDELEGLYQEEFGIPLGTLTGWLFFSGKGPTVRVALLSVGDVVVQLHHQFEEAGINQTLHQVFLDIEVTVYLMIPGEILSTTVDSQICVAETVIVGEVPETYLYIGNGELG